MKYLIHALLVRRTGSSVLLAPAARRPGTKFRQAVLGLTLFLVGCLGDPRLDGAPGDAATEGPDAAEDIVHLERSAERDAWESAAPGCEDVALEDFDVVSCEGEDELGCVVDAAGRVHCVDALGVLLSEVAAIDWRPRTDDPSPQPSTTAIGATMSGLRRDPTPTPIVRASRPDPTPTPMHEADGGDQEDPTPTPMNRPR